MFVPDIVCYHSPCDDGWIAAMIAYKFYDEKNLTIPEFVEGNYGNTDKDFWINKVRGKKVLVVDFSFKGSLRKVIETACDSMLILDHHASARNEYGKDVLPLHTDDRSLSVDDAEALIKDTKIVMIMSDEHCGSSMTWDFFFPNISRPELLEYIEDQDLGKRRLPNATSFTYWLRSRTSYKNPENYDFLRSLENENDYHKAMAEGKAVYTYLSLAFETAAQAALVGPATIETGGEELTVGIAFAPYAFASEFATFMVRERKLDAAMVLYPASDLNCGFSIRGRKNDDGSNTNYARLIAESLGGGGHDMAAGANLSLVDGMHLISNIVSAWKN